LKREASLRAVTRVEPDLETRVVVVADREAILAREATTKMKRVVVKVRGEVLLAAIVEVRVGVLTMTRVKEVVSLEVGLEATMTTKMKLEALMAATVDATTRTKTAALQAT
jgi:hypothetical protein